MGVSAADTLVDEIPPSAFAPTAGRSLIPASDPDLVAAVDEQYRRDESQSSRIGALEAVLSGLAMRSKGSQAEYQRRFTPTESLATLKNELIAIETRVNFDYIAMISRTCMSLLVLFVDACKSAALKPNDLSGSVGDGPAAAYYFLKRAADVDAKVKSSTSSMDVTATPFAAGAAELQKALCGGLGKTLPLGRIQ